LGPFEWAAPFFVTLKQQSKCNGDGARSQHDLLITRLFACRDLAVLRQCGGGITQNRGEIMAKRKKGAKVQKRGKLRRGNSAKRGKPRKVKAAVAKAKPKRAPVKKAAPKVKQPVAPVVETVAVEVIEQPVAVTEVEETRKAS
jgi:hypothetical protein